MEMSCVKKITNQDLDVVIHSGYDDGSHDDAYFERC